MRISTVWVEPFCQNWGSGAKVIVDGVGAGVGDGEVVAPAREARRLLVHEDPVVVGRLEVGRERQRDLAADDAVALGGGLAPRAPDVARRRLVRAVLAGRERHAVRAVS